MQRNGTVAVGFDGSYASWTALDYAATEAVLRGLDIRLVHAVLEPAAYAETALIIPIEDAPVEARRLLAFANNYLNRQYGDLGVRFSIGTGTAGRLLVRESRTAKLLVVGRRGRGTRTATIGSVSAYVATHSACTVLVVSATPRSPTGPVLLGVDLATPAASAIRFAFDAADRHGTDLIACHVLTATRPTASTTPTRPHHPDDLDTIRRTLEATLAQARTAYPDVPVRIEVVHDAEPAAGLLNLADTASLVVVGHHDETRAQKRTHRSVTAALLRHTSSPVVITHATTTGASMHSGARSVPSDIDVR